MVSQFGDIKERSSLSNRYPGTPHLIGFELLRYSSIIMS
jgi:hypothetical protein